MNKRESRTKRTTAAGPLHAIPASHSATTTGIDARIDVAVGAACQLIGIFDSLVEEACRLAESDRLRESATIKALAIRGRRLANTSLAMLEDELESVERCRRIVDVDDDDPLLPHVEAANGH